MNNKNSIKIPSAASQVEAIRLIKSFQKDATKPLHIDLTEASFSLSRDFFFVLSKRFHTDEIILILEKESEMKMAKSVWIQAELAGTLAEFEREFEKKNLLAHNMTMWEYFLYEVRRGFGYIRFLIVEKLFSRKPQKMLHFREHSPNMFLMVAGLIISLTLLLFIFHFAVSKTYVKIVPQITIRPISANIIYALSGTGGSELSQAKNIISQKILSIPVEHTMQFTLDTIDPNSTSNAVGTVTIINELTTEQALKPQTRFITETGEVFRSQNWVNVPASKTLNGITEIGKAEVSVMADPNDEAGKVIGVRWNIRAWTDLTIPWLKFNRDKVYAKAKEDFTGWQDPKVHIVTEAEVKKFEWILKEQLLRVARTNLQKTLDENKQKLGEDFALLMGDGVSFSGETITLVSGQKYGDLADEITLKWSVVVRAITYDRKATLAYLTDVFREGLLRWTDKELAIHADTLRMTNVVSRAEDDSRIKATMEMNVSITYDFENAANELTRHMKVLIAWLSKKDAISRLINDGHVKEIDISFSPFWISTVSSNIDNIEFIIQK